MGGEQASEKERVKFRERTDGGLVFFCPACQLSHAIKSPTWQIDRATLTVHPSIKTEWVKTDDDGNNPVPVVCHIANIVNGVINYAGDSTHDHANKSVPLPDWPY